MGSAISKGRSYERSKCIATNGASASLLEAPGLTTRNKKLLVTRASPLVTNARSPNQQLRRVLLVTAPRVGLPRGEGRVEPELRKRDNSVKFA